MDEVFEGSDQTFDHPDCTLHYQQLDRKRLVFPHYLLFFERQVQTNMLGEALRLIRVFHDCKTGELAEGLDMSASYISEIESGKKTPSIEIINKYADYFDTTPSAIMFFSEDLKANEKKFNKAGVRAKLIKFLQIMENATETRKS